MINMISRKLLPIIIHCSELRRVGVLEFYVLRSTESPIYNLKNAFATKTQRFTKAVNRLKYFYGLGVKWICGSSISFYPMQDRTCVPQSKIVNLKI